MRERAFERGAVYVEFLFVVGPLVLLFFGLTQIGLLFAAQLAVEHAAGRATRAAIVILPDEAKKEGEYGGDPINQIAPSIAKQPALLFYSLAPEGGRLDLIRRAARLVLAPFSPALLELATLSNPNDMTGALGVSGVVSGFASYFYWTERAVAVTFPDGSGHYRSSVGSTEDITVRVTYLFKCSVPIVRGLICNSLDKIDPQRQAELMSLKGYQELQKGSAAAKLLSADGGWRFAALTAERTLPNQGKP